MFNKKLLPIYLFMALTVMFMGCSNKTTNEEAERKPVDEEVAAETEKASKEKNSENEKSTANKEKGIPDGFRVTTIGAGSPSTKATKTWASTLVQYKDKYFLVDCGGGCTQGLTKVGISPSKINNLLFTHHHADHNSDFLTLLIAGWATNNPRTELNIVGPTGTKKLYDFAIDFYSKDIKYRIDSGFTSSDGIIDNVHVSMPGGGEEMELDGIKISTVEVPHSIEALAYKFEADGQSVVVTGDTKYSEDLIKFSKDAALMVADGMLTEVKSDDPFYDEFQRLKSSLSIAHMSLEEIGQIAAKANVKKIILTHLFNGEMDTELTTKKLRDEGYTGEVIIAESLGKYDVE